MCIAHRGKHFVDDIFTYIDALPVAVHRRRELVVIKSSGFELDK
jgi:hypothetical protein